MTRLGVYLGRGSIEELNTLRDLGRVENFSRFVADHIHAVYEAELTDEVYTKEIAEVERRKNLRANLRTTMGKKREEMNDELRDVLEIWRRVTGGRTGEDRAPEENNALVEWMENRMTDWKGIFKQKGAGEIIDQLDGIMDNEL